jgi:hypothetical protein
VGRRVGTRVEHFTVDVGALASFPDVEAVAALLDEHGFAIEREGSDPALAQRIEEAASVRDPIDIAFDDQVATIPSSIYRFMRRLAQAPVSVAK